MRIQTPLWTNFLSCPVCSNEFNTKQRVPISLGCGHTMCRGCLKSLHNRQCPFDQSILTRDVLHLPVNSALLQLVGNDSNPLNNNGGSQNSSGQNSNLIPNNSNENDTSPGVRELGQEEFKNYIIAKECTEDLALHLRSFVSNLESPLSRPIQRKLVTLINCQLIKEEGRVRALRAARCLGERTVNELIVQHQNPKQLSSNLWASVRSRGCLFCGPPMQKEILRLILLALDDGSALSRKVLVMFIVKRLEPQFAQVSNTSIGHVIQLLYRASCFRVSAREANSSLMQLKEEFRTYDALRREHDAQIVQIATESGLRIAPDQWSSFLYGDNLHKSYMQSIIDKLQTPSSFAQSVQELLIAFQRTGDPNKLKCLCTHLKELSSIDTSVENAALIWEELAKALDAVRQVVIGLVEFMEQHANRKIPNFGGGQEFNPNIKYKISLCRDLTTRGACPRGTKCTYAHSEEEMEHYRAKSQKSGVSGMIANASNASLLNNDHFRSQHHHFGYAAHTAAVAAAIGDKVSPPISPTASSSTRYTTSTSHESARPSVSTGSSNKRAGTGFSDCNSATHSLGSISQSAGGHHIRLLHQNPISTASGPLLGTGNSSTGGTQRTMTTATMGQHRLESSTYGSLNYTAPPPHAPIILQSARNSTVNDVVISPMNFPVLTLETSQLIQQPLTPQTTLGNASTVITQSSLSSTGSSSVLENNGIYNFNELYNVPSNYFNTAAADAAVTNTTPVYNRNNNNKNNNNNNSNANSDRNAFNGTGTTSAASSVGNGHISSNSNNIEYPYSPTSNMMSPDNLLSASFASKKFNYNKMSPHLFWNSRERDRNCIDAFSRFTLIDEGAGFFDSVIGRGTK